MTQNDEAWADAVASLPDLRRTQRSADTERVLGQIERGEVRVGPDAAREIAAKAEAAYGGAWHRATVRPISAAPAATPGADAA
ncbi:hypothetical protein AB0H77_15480 [Streptomyces sp. NPDC050844]|uniref:hypothetical protein n=1 Tax=Streptomyces sp. NPDC050844 TaxID=3155790 RepID=UPI0033CD01C4